MAKDDQTDFMDDAAAGEARPLGPAVMRGWRGRCPNCASGQLFTSYLKVGQSCEFCGLDFSHHRADDAPSWLTMIVVGHILAPLILAAYGFFDLPMAAHLVIWPTLAIVGILVLLPRIKGGIIAFQWAHRMHGFDDDPHS